MDNQHSAGGFLQHLLDANPQIGQAIHNFVRGLSNQHAAPREPSLPLDDPDLADMPPLEPIPDYPASREGPQQREEQSIEDVARSDGPTSSSLPAAEASSQQNRAAYAESVGSMPSLHTVSDWDTDVDMHDVEPGVYHQLPTDVDSSPQTGSRRARVDDEVDEEDMRETNRQRMTSPDPSDDASAQQARPASSAAHPQQHHAPPNDPPPPYSNQRVYSFDVFPGPEQDAPQQGPQGDAEAQGQGHHHHFHNHPLPMFNLTFHIGPPPDVPAGPHPVPDGTPQMAGFPPQFFPFAPGAEPFFMSFFPFGPPREEEIDNPERAEKLVRGLEEVPEGLVSRIERLGGDDGDSLCSVCWEKLSSEGGGFDTEEQAGTGAEANAGMDVDGHAAPSPATSTDTPSTKNELPKVVALPCAHVFHTSCLLPWFTKPHRTTCPSCRFDIDPESLTYAPPRRRRQQQAAPTEGPAPAQAGAQPPQAPATADARPAPAQTQGVPQSMPNSRQPGAPDATQDQPPHPGPTADGIPFEFNLFFPVMGGPGGPAGGYVPLDAQATRNLFQRLFSGAPPQPPQQAPQEAQAQHPQPVPAANASVPGAMPNAQNSPAGGPNPSTWGIPNMWQNLFGVQPPQPQANANPPAGAVPQRPASAASTGSRGQGRARPPEKRQWTLPAPPGQTLRQRVERLERERGLRCWDVSCGLGPSDEDPFPVIDPSTMRNISINRMGGNSEKVCEHTFHPSCLVSAERVAGWGGEDKKEEKEGEEVEVSCPVCRAVGVIPRMDWDEGACALA